MAAPQQQGSQSDNSTGILWGAAALFVALGAIWYSFKDYLVSIFLTIKLYEVNLLSFFNQTYFGDIRIRLVTALAKPQNIPFPEVVALGDSVGDWLRFPFVIILFILAFAIYLGNATRVYRRLYSMQDLVKLEHDNWPQITPVINLDLIKSDIDKGPWAMAMTPVQFCKRYRLLDEVRPDKREGMSRKEWGKVEAVLKRGDANKVFALQLGQLWAGTHKLPLHARALFAAFAARINADSGSAAELFAQLSISSTTKLNFSGVNELLKKY